MTAVSGLLLVAFKHQFLISTALFIKKIAVTVETSELLRGRQAMPDNITAHHTAGFLA